MSNTSPLTPLGSPINTPPTVKNIQALRGVAALLVLWAHLKFPLTTLCPGLESFRFIQTAYGAIGVDLFFVISGYVICLTACKRHHKPLDFFLARLARVSPLYLTIGVPTFLAMTIDSWPSFKLRHAWNGFFYLPIFDWGNYTFPPVSVGWTLSFEMWFYVVFALLLNFCSPRKVAILLPLIFAVGAVVMIFYPGGWYFPRFAFHPFVLEFALGCIAYQIQPLMKKNIPLYLVAGGILYMLFFTEHTGYLGFVTRELSDRLDLAWLRFASWGVPMAVFVAGLVGMERHHNYVLPRPFVWLGGISYSLYLTHLYTYIGIASLGPSVGLHNPIATLAILPTVSIFFAWLCWKWVENPLTIRARNLAREYSRERKHSPTEPVAKSSVSVNSQP